MLMLVINVVYVLIALAMVALILMQRGAGAQAGSGFGGGASATVFGSRGASNFLSKSTKWLAIVFFGISLGMAWYATHNATRDKGPVQQDLGLMADVPVAPAPASGGSVPAAPAAERQAPAASTVPAAPAQPDARQPAPPAK
jgi:preprotein translocase subunit SecG